MIATQLQLSFNNNLNITSYYNTMNRFNNISNSELSALIDEWVRGERDRFLMKRRLIDCVKLEALAEEFSLSVQHTASIVRKNVQILSEKTAE